MRTEIEKLEDMLNEGDIDYLCIHMNEFSKHPTEVFTIDKGHQLYIQIPRGRTLSIIGNEGPLDYAVFMGMANHNVKEFGYNFKAVDMFEVVKRKLGLE